MLLDVTHFIDEWCGVYLLCRGQEILYIGQSVNVPSRIVGHLWESREKHWARGREGRVRAKRFCTVDAAYFLRVPESELDAVEGALIRHFEPSLNGGDKRRYGRVMAPKPSVSGDAFVLASLVRTLQQGQPPPISLSGPVLFTAAARAVFLCANTLDKAA